MAFQIFWKIPFKSLRTGTLYTVNIYKDGTLPSGYPLTLKGGAQPFTTQEDDSDDMFTPIRTQTGYLRIVDDGHAVNSASTPATVNFNWKELLPSTDTDRPVTLTHVSNGQTVVDWQGFMQAQNFSGTLYGGTQEREYPIQCLLTILEGTDINYQQESIQNFAYLLKQIIDSIDSSVRPQNFLIQGGTDAQEWLLKRIDWQNFVGEDGDGNLVAMYSMYQCLEDMCRFWGWTARTKGDTLYLTMADDATVEPNWLSMDDTDLATMAGGIAAGTTSATFDTTNLTGDIFASTNQEDYVQRGHNKAVVDAETNRADDSVLNVFNDKVIEQMKDAGQQSGMVHDVIYTNDVLSADQNFLKIQCREGYGSLNIGYFGYASDAPYVNVIRIKKTGANNVTPFVTMETKYEHCFNDGFFRMYGQTYRYSEEYLDPFNRFAIGRSYMIVRICIGNIVNGTRQGKWWNGQTWQDNPTYCLISIGNKENNLDANKNEFFFEKYQYMSTEQDASNILPVDGLTGKLYVDLLGTDNTRVEEIDGERSFELKDFIFEFTRNPGVVKHGSANYSTYCEDIERPTRFGYESRNQNSVRNEWNADVIYATENACKFCYGEIINPDGSFVQNVGYGNTEARPEQHLANRVTDYWQTSKRKLEVELRTNEIADITPRFKVTIDGITGYPITISRNWRDDITQLTILEL